MEDFIKHLKVGDKVVIVGREDRIITTVAKITPTGRISTNYYQFDKCGNSIGGSSFDYKHLEEATPELIDEVRAENRHKQCYRILNKKQFADYPLEKLEQILSILESK